MRKRNAELAAGELRLKRLENDKSVATAYLEASLETMPDGVVLHDKEGRYVYVNPAFLKLVLVVYQVGSVFDLIAGGGDIHRLQVLRPASEQV